MVVVSFWMIVLRFPLWFTSSRTNFFGRDALGHSSALRASKPNFSNRVLPAQRRNIN